MRSGAALTSSPAGRPHGIQPIQVYKVTLFKLCWLINTNRKRKEQEENCKGQWKKHSSEEQMEHEKKICKVTQRGSPQFLFCLYAPAPVVSNPSGPNYVASQCKTKVTCDFVSVLLSTLLHSTVLPFASAAENKQVLSMGNGRCTQ